MLRYALALSVALSVMGCQADRATRVPISAEHAKELDLTLSGGIASDGSGSVYLTTPTTLMRYEPDSNRLEDLLNESRAGLRDVAVTPDGVVLTLHAHELSACAGGYLIELHRLTNDAYALSCDREFAYVLATANQGARLFRIQLTGSNKGWQQTLLTTEDRPKALYAVEGGCLVASGGNIVKVTDPAPDGQVATVLLVAMQEPVTSVVADQARKVVYFATADTTYAWIQGRIVPIFPAGSRLAWARDTLTICLSSPTAQMIQVPAVSRHAQQLAKQLQQNTPRGKP